MQDDCKIPCNRLSKNENLSVRIDQIIDSSPSLSRPTIISHIKGKIDRELLAEDEVVKTANFDDFNIVSNETSESGEVINFLELNSDAIGGTDRMTSINVTFFDDQIDNLKEEKADTILQNGEVSARVVFSPVSICGVFNDNIEARSDIIEDSSLVAKTPFSVMCRDLRSESDINIIDNINFMRFIESQDTILDRNVVVPDKIFGTGKISITTSEEDFIDLLSGYISSIDATYVDEEAFLDNVINAKRHSLVVDAYNRKIVFYEKDGNISASLSVNSLDTWYEFDRILPLGSERASRPLAISDKRNDRILLLYVLDDSFLAISSISPRDFDIRDSFAKVFPFFSCEDGSRSFCDRSSTEGSSGSLSLTPSQNAADPQLTTKGLRLRCGISNIITGDPLGGSSINLEKEVDKEFVRFFSPDIDSLNEDISNIIYTAYIDNLARVVVIYSLDGKSINIKRSSDLSNWQDIQRDLRFTHTVAEQSSGNEDSDFSVEDFDEDLICDREAFSNIRLTALSVVYNKNTDAAHLSYIHGGKLYFRLFDNSLLNQIISLSQSDVEGRDEGSLTSQERLFKEKFIFTEEAESSGRRLLLSEDVAVEIDPAILIDSSGNVRVFYMSSELDIVFSRISTSRISDIRN